MYCIMSSANSEFFFFFSSLDSFSLSSLIAVDKTLKTMLNNSGKSGHPYFVPDLKGDGFRFSPLRIVFAMGLSCMAFNMLRYVPSMPTFWTVFIINGC